MPTLNQLIRIILRILPLCVLLTLWLYLYPAVQRCAFPLQTAREGATYSREGEQAPFRLLTLGDPQLEGDTKLPHPDDPWLPSLKFGLYGDLEEYHNLTERWHATEPSDRNVELFWIAMSALAHVVDIVRVDIPTIFWTPLKRLDLFGNDFYLAHVYRTMQWWTEPTHVVVLGDLLGSQWIEDPEFHRRADRFWNRVFKGGEKTSIREKKVSDADLVENVQTTAEGEPIWTEILGEDPAWRNRIICIAGNHDVGYAGELLEERVVRFEETFGKVNWEVRFQIARNENRADPDAPLPELRLVILNTMNLDIPAYSQDIQMQTYDFLNGAIGSGRPMEEPSAATIILTHIPLYKPEGVCVDPPFFTYHPPEEGGGIREQNHLSEASSRGPLLEGFFGLGRGGKRGKGIVLNGHDHEGCDTIHRARPNPDRAAGNDSLPPVLWDSIRYEEAEYLGWMHAQHADMEAIREVTVRSMMGEFSGNAGLLSAWWDGEHGEWRFEYATCVLGVQHIWWAIHVADVIVVVALVVAAMRRVAGVDLGQVEAPATQKKKVHAAREGAERRADETASAQTSSSQISGPKSAKKRTGGGRKVASKPP